MMHLPRARGLAAIAAVLLPLLAACGGAPAAPQATPEPIVQTVVVAGTPQTVVVTATPEPAEPAPEATFKDTLIIGAWQEPRGFYDVANAQAIRQEIELIYRPRWVTRLDYGYQPNPALVEGDVPSLEEGGAELVDVTVKAGEPIFDLGRKAVVRAEADTPAKQLVVTGRIKAGLLWDDGEPLTARDFVFGWQLNCSADSGAVDLTYCPFEAVPGSAGLVSRYEALDDTTLELAFTPGAIDPLYPILVFGPEGTPQPEHLFRDASPATLQEDERATGGTSAVPLGYGPYKMVEWKKGESLTFEANPHWSGQAPKTQRVIYRFFADAVAVASAVIAGDIDSSSGQVGVDIDQFPYLSSVAKNGDVNFLINKDAARFEFLTLNLSDPTDKTLARPHPLLSDVKVRKAIAMALNRQQMVDTIFYGQSAVVEQPHLPQMISYDLAQGTIAFDLEGAKKLMDEAGWTDSDGDGVRDKGGVKAAFTIVTTSGVPLRQKATQLAQADLAALGVEVSLSFVPSAVLISPDIYYSRAFDVILLANTFSTTDPGNWWYTSFACDQIPLPENGFAGGNYSGWCDQEVSDAVTEANFLTLDTERRKAAWNTALKGFFERGYTIVPLYIRPSMAATVPELSGVSLNATEYVTHNIHEWALLDVGQ
jgi:peptide/nickel transport system substrate-binding protein